MDVVLLFDEQGTPTFVDDRETDSFLGIAITYNLLDEELIFEECDTDFGLSNKRPLKNKHIRISRAIRISELITRLPIQITIKSINLADEDFQRIVTLYSEFGTLMREIHRNVRGRTNSQTLHIHILDNTLFESIIKNIELNKLDSNFLVYIDDWAIPSSDIEIALKVRSSSLEQKINSILNRFPRSLNINVSPIQLMNEDSKRKRLIDVIASVVSRSFLCEENERYTSTPLSNILSNPLNEINDITDYLKSFFRNFMDQSLRQKN